MKKLLLLFLWLSISAYAKAQIGLNLAYTKPSGDFGYLFKPAQAYGLVFYSSTLDERFQLSYGLSFANYKARRDTFFAYGIQGGGSGTKYLPAYEVWNSYYIISARAQGDYLILDKDFTPTIGLGLLFNTAVYNRDSELKTVINQSEINNDLFIGYLVKGFIYRIFS